jgi:hypothetical protein
VASYINSIQPGEDKEKLGAGKQFWVFFGLTDKSVSLIFNPTSPPAHRQAGVGERERMVLTQLQIGGYL